MSKEHDARVGVSGQRPYPDKPRPWFLGDGFDLRTEWLTWPIGECWVEALQ